MVATRGAAVRDRLEALAGAGLGIGAFSAAVFDLLGRAVPFDFGCLATTDPATGIATASRKSHDVDVEDAEFARYEYGAEDVNSFAEIVRRPVPVGVLALDTAGRPEVSSRYREFLVPRMSTGHELRAGCRAEDRVWGIVGLYRQTGPGGFSGAEADFVAGVAGTVAVGLRGALLASAVLEPAAVSGPAVLVVGDRGDVLQATPAALDLLAELGGQRPESLPMPVPALVAAARGQRAGLPGAPPRARLRTPAGRWVLAQAAPLSGGAGDVVVTLEHARPPEILPLVVAALGLTRREQDVVELVLAGEGTAAIGRRLHLSPYTVQDHLKSVFAKAGVGSRRELVARVFVDHYGPRFGQPVGVDGGLAAG